MILHFQAGVSEPVLAFLKAKAVAEARSLSNLAGKILSEYFTTQQARICERDDASEVK